jgi:hypothetical protein
VEAVLELARNIMRNRRVVAEESDVEHGRGVVHNNSFLAGVVEGDQHSSSSPSVDNMALIERALFGPDEADDIFSSARSALALSSAAATIASSRGSSSSSRRPWTQNYNRRRNNNIESIEASVRAAHHILDRLETEHRRRKKEKYIKLVRALGRTSMIVQESQLLIHDDTVDAVENCIPREENTCILPSEDKTVSDQEECNNKLGQQGDGEVQGAEFEVGQENSTIGNSLSPTTPVSPPTLHTNNTHRVFSNDHPSMDDDDDNEHTILCIPLLCTNALFQHATTTGSTPYSSTTVIESNAHRNVPSTCVICLVQYQSGDHVSWSSNEECSHAFHRDCILIWLLKKNVSDGFSVGSDNHNERRYLCPCCRREFVSESILVNGDAATTTTEIVGDGT